MTKLTIDLDPGALPTVSLVDLFMQVGLALEMRGQWILTRNIAGVPSPLERFLDQLPLEPLEVWAQAALAEAGRRGIQIVSPRPQGWAPTPAITTRLLGTERAMAEGGYKIPAIKALRDRTGVGLKEAKDEVDAWVANAQARRAEALAKALSEPLTPGPGSAL